MLLVSNTTRSKNRATKTWFIKNVVCDESRKMMRVIGILTNYNWSVEQGCIQEGVLFGTVLILRLDQQGWKKD